MSPQSAVAAGTPASTIIAGVIALNIGVRLFGRNGWTHSDWINFAVAAGTLALAGVTSALALVARQDVRTSRTMAEATVDQAKATRQEVAASVEQLALLRQQAQATLDELQLTRAQVDLGQRQVEATQLAAAAAIRPLLVDVPPEAPESGRHVGSVSGARSPADILMGTTSDDNGISFYVPIRNVGPGPAFITRCLVSAGSIVFDATPTRAVIPSGEVGGVRAGVRPSDPGYSSMLHALPHAAFELNVRYTDVGGAQPTATFYEFSRRDDSLPVEVTKIRLHHVDTDGTPDAQPFVTSGPASAS